MIIWLWEASGPGDYCGVVDAVEGALGRAEGLIADGRASTARVEQAYAQMGGLWLKSDYQRTGAGWSAVRTDDGTVRWVPLSRPAPAASLITAVGSNHAGTDMTVEASSTDALIKQWRSSGQRVEQIAAELAAKIDAGQLHRYEELPLQAALADEYDVSERTITSVKRLLAVHDFLTLENQRYYIA